MEQSALVQAESRFTGGAFANFFIGLLTGIVSVITLGLAYPAMICWKLRWKARHTYINGRRLVFDGKGTQLFGKFLLWLFLSVITIGIYAILAMPLNMNRWEAKHTHFEGVTNKESCFDGSIFGLFGVKLWAGFVTIITLTLGSYWAHCYRERWYKRHTVIDDCRLFFDGKAGQYFGKRFVWILLTILTLGIYSFWLIVKKIQWTVYHTRALSLPDEIAGEISEVPTLVKESIIVPKSIEQKSKKQGRASIVLGLMPLVLFLIACLLGFISVEHYDFHSITEINNGAYYYHNDGVCYIQDGANIYIREAGVWYYCDTCTKIRVAYRWICISIIILIVIVALVGVVLSLMNFKINRVHHKKIALSSMIINSVMFIIFDPLLLLLLQLL